jgi:hypothetical protein
LRLIGFEELHQFSRVEEIEEMIDEFEVISIVSMKKISQLLDIIFPWSSLAQSRDVHEDVDGLLDLEIDHTDINRFVIFLKERSIAVSFFFGFVLLRDLFVLSLLID